MDKQLNNHSKKRKLLLKLRRSLVHVAVPMNMISTVGGSRFTKKTLKKHTKCIQVIVIAMELIDNIIIFAPESKNSMSKKTWQKKRKVKRKKK